VLEFVGAFAGAFVGVAVVVTGAAVVGMRAAKAKLAGGLGFGSALAGPAPDEPASVPGP